jgi:dodecin
MMTYGKERVYKKVEVVGTGAGSIEAAIQAAVSKAQATLEGLSWFEVVDIHGHIDAEGKVTEYQVVLKVAFALK